MERRSVVGGRVLLPKRTNGLRRGDDHELVDVLKAGDGGALG